MATPDIFEPAFSLRERIAGFAAEKIRSESPPENRNQKLAQRAYAARLSFPNHTGGYDGLDREIARAKREKAEKGRQPVTAERLKHWVALAFATGPKPTVTPRKPSRGKRDKRDLRIGKDRNGLDRFLPVARFDRKRFTGRSPATAA